MRRLVAWLALTLLLSACAAPAPIPTATPEPTATQTTPTATIEWFPATSTPTSVPTPAYTPTPDQRPGVGDLLFTEDFSLKTGWTTGKTTVGSVAFGVDALTLSVSAEKSLLSSLREGKIAADSYLEITATPSLCRGDDAYGLLIRAAAAQDAYRLVLTCNAQARLERVRGGRFLPLQDWTPALQIAPGGMLPVRIGVWAYMDELRFFFNDIYQFSIHDPVFPSGQLGVFARSAGETPLSVSFSDLQIYDLER